MFDVKSLLSTGACFCNEQITSWNMQPLNDQPLMYFGEWQWLTFDSLYSLLKSLKYEAQNMEASWLCEFSLNLNWESIHQTMILNNCKQCTRSLLFSNILQKCWMCRIQTKSQLLVNQSKTWLLFQRSRIETTYAYGTKLTEFVPMPISPLETVRPMHFR